MKNKIKNQLMSIMYSLIVVVLLISNGGIVYAQTYENGQYVDYYRSDGTYPVYIEHVSAPIAQERVSIPSNLVVPVRFRYQVHGDDLEAGDGLSLEVVDNVYVGNSLVFRQGGGGVARVSAVKRAGFLGRGGNIEINSGELTDIYGTKHLISLTSNTKGKGSLGPVVLTLLSSGLAVALVPDLLFDNVESTLFGAGLALAPIHFAMKHGKEAKVSDGKVMFARIVSSVAY